MKDKYRSRLFGASGFVIQKANGNSNPTIVILFKDKEEAENSADDIWGHQGFNVRVTETDFGIILTIHTGLYENTDFHNHKLTLSEFMESIPRKGHYSVYVGFTNEQGEVKQIGAGARMQDYSVTNLD